MATAQGVFLKGSILRHILVMSSTSTLGLLSIFLVDLLDMYFLSLLGDSKIVAGVGFSSTLLFLLFSLCIGMQIAMGALVARAEGQHQRDVAGRYCSNVALVGMFVLAVCCLLVWSYLEDLLSLIGAQGEVLEHALTYSRIMLPSMMIVVVSMSGGAALRAIGDAKRSMYSTLLGGFANAVLDPIFIFYFAWGVEGAAWASVISRLVVFGIIFHALFFHHRLPQATSIKAFLEDLPKIMRISAPALVTNIMTPLGGAIVLKFISVYGPAAVAAYAVWGRIIPVAFGALFSLSGAIGPIIGQNAGALQYARVRSALLISTLVSAIYVLCIWLLMFLLFDSLIKTFNIHDEGIVVLKTQTHYLLGLFFFAALLFISNATFNNLNKPHWSMLFNIARTFLGTVPFVIVFSHWFGLTGLLVGDSSGVIIFGCLAFFIALKLINQLEQQQVKEVQALKGTKLEENDTKPSSVMGSI